MSLSYQAILDDSPTGFWTCSNIVGNVVPAVVGSNASISGTSYTNYGSMAGPYANALKITSSTTETRLLTNIGAGQSWTTFSAECYFRPDSLAQESHIISKTQYYAQTQSQFPFSIRLKTDGSILMSLDNGGDFVANTEIISSTGLIVVGSWYHVVGVVRANGLCELYVNNVLRGSATIGYSLSTSSVPFAFGGASALYGGGVNAMSFVGSIAGCAIFPSALSSARVAAHYNTVTPYYVQGTVTANSVAAASRTVRAYRRDTGALVGATTTNAQGEYSISVAEWRGEVNVVALDDVSGTTENDLILRTTPVTI